MARVGCGPEHPRIPSNAAAVQHICPTNHQAATAGAAAATAAAVMPIAAPGMPHPAAAAVVQAAALSQLQPAAHHAKTTTILGVHPTGQCWTVTLHAYGNTSVPARKLTQMKTQNAPASEAAAATSRPLCHTAAEL